MSITSKGDFHVSPNKTVKTDMMFAKEEYAYVMAIRVVEFSNGGYKIRKIFA